jgi:hypothetical protein
VQERIRTAILHCFDIDNDFVPEEPEPEHPEPDENEEEDDNDDDDDDGE